MRIATPPVVASLASQHDLALSSALLAENKQRVAANPYPRESLSRILSIYNHEIGNHDQSVLENLRKLGNSDSCCVVTGQQLGVMGGPAYTMLKGISCLLVARQIGAVPIFWLATEDHDTTEVDHVDVLDSAGNLKRFRLSLPKGTSVETIRLTHKNLEELEMFFSFIGLKDFPLPSIGELYAEAMARSLARLFAGTGMLFLEPKLIRPLALPWIRREIVESRKIHSILKSTTENLKNQGKEVAADVGEGTNLFLIDSQGKRVKIHRNGESSFTASLKSYSQQELLSYLEEQPEKFSPNVFARPLVQNALLPIVAYIGGAAELDYHQQLTDYHAFHNVRMPCLIPRISATFITKEAGKILDAFHLNPWEDWQLSTKDIHLLENLIHPRKRPQERVLNWWGFQVKTPENLVDACLRELSWDTQTPYYLYL